MSTQGCNEIVRVYPVPMDEKGQHFNSPCWIIAPDGQTLLIVGVFIEDQSHPLIGPSGQKLNVCLFGLADGIITIYEAESVHQTYKYERQKLQELFKRIQQFILNPERHPTSYLDLQEE